MALYATSAVPSSGHGRWIGPATGRHTLCPAGELCDLAAAHSMQARITSVTAGLREDIEGEKLVHWWFAETLLRKARDALLLADIVESH